jgi:hypothetical protein
MCETFNVARDAIVSAAQADTILCYVQNMSSLISDITDNDGHPIDVYDGEWHIFNLNITGAGDGSPDKVKMQIIREGENITSFKMFMCVRDGEGLIQNEYTEQLLDGDGLSMTAKGRYRDEWAGTHEVNVTGEFDDDGAYTQKTIETKNSGSEIGNEENTNWQEVTFTQTPGEFTVSGYQRGNHTDQGGSGTYQQAAYGVGQMLGDASPVIANLAMGNGAVNVDSAYTWDNDEHGQGGEDFPSEVFAWLGDTLASVDPASDSSYYDDASEGTVPTPADSVSFAFTTAQTWDCSDDVAVAVDLPAVSEETMNAACSQYGAMKHSWINCYEIMGQE